MENEVFNPGPLDKSEPRFSEETVTVFLSDMFANGTPQEIVAGIGAVARARGMTQVARDAGVSRESLYRALSGQGNPEFGTIMKVIRALGLKLITQPVHINTVTKPQSAPLRKGSQRM